MAQKWNAAKASMPQRWQQGLAEAGVNVGPLTTQAYQAGIANAQFSVPSNAPQKWQQNYMDGMSR
jgi:hypothetical protein